MAEVIKNRSEILFLYDVRDANPNGDPVDENRPRIDAETGINIVTDVRLKRTIRDYFVDLIETKNPRLEEQDVFVKERRDEEGFLLDAKTVAKGFFPDVDDVKQLTKLTKEKICQKCIDVRLFGGIIPVEFKPKKKEKKSTKDTPKDNTSKDAEKEENIEQEKIVEKEISTDKEEIAERDENTDKIKNNVITLTGPVQFKYGRSLHKVDGPIYIKGTGAFADKYDRNNKKLQFTFREEYILHYSLICFYGIVNENAARDTRLTPEDVDLLLEGIWNGTKNLISRSKAGQMPRLLIQVVYKDKNFYAGELDKRICLKSRSGSEIDTPESIRDISEVKVDITNLVETLNCYKDKIEKIRIKVDDRIVFTKDGTDTDIKSALSNLTIEDFDF